MCSSILAGTIPRTEEPGRLRLMGSQTDTIDRLTHKYILEPDLFLIISTC